MNGVSSTDLEVFPSLQAEMERQDAQDHHLQLEKGLGGLEETVVAQEPLLEACTHQALDHQAVASQEIDPLVA
jgi:hypothetical protein